MKWDNYFDGIYIINLPNAEERRFECIRQMELIDVDDYSFYWGIENRENPASGLADTFKELFTYALSRGVKDLVVFEDDFKFLNQDTSIIEQTLFELPNDYLQLYLGINATEEGFNGFYSDHLLKVKKGYSAHAVAYSKECMELILKIDEDLPIDVSIANHIHPLGRSYAICPMQVTQRPGYSYIEKREVNYKCFLEDRFDQAVNKLQNGL